MTKVAVILVVATAMLLASNSFVDAERVPVYVANAIMPYLPVNVGTPPTTNWLSFDAGSPILWTSAVDGFDRKGVAPDGQKYTMRYNPEQSTTAEDQGENNTFVYGGPSVMEGRLYVDEVGLAELPSVTNIMQVTVATYLNGGGFGSSVDGGILGMDMESTIMKGYFENYDVPKEEQYYVTNFNAFGDSYFDIGDDSLLKSKKIVGDVMCVDTVPLNEEDRLVPKEKPGPIQPTFTMWWQYPVKSFRMGGTEITAKTQQSFADNGCTAILGNFQGFFPEGPVPENLCDYLCEEGTTFDIVLETGVLSLGYEDVSTGTQCYLEHSDSFPDTLIISGWWMYNKYVTKHDYNGQICWAEKAEYAKIGEGKCKPGSGSGQGRNEWGYFAASIAAFVVLMLA